MTEYSISDLPESQPPPFIYPENIVALINIGNDPNADIRARTHAHLKLRISGYPHHAAKIAALLIKEEIPTAPHKLCACLTLGKTTNVREAFEGLLEIARNELNPIKIRLLAARKLWLFSLPGSADVRRRVKILSAEPINSVGENWLVTGGQHRHRVKVISEYNSEHVSFSYKCDCAGASSAISNTCSHIALVRYMFETIFFQSASQQEKVLGWIHLALPRLESKIARGDLPFEEISYEAVRKISDEAVRKIMVSPKNQKTEKKKSKVATAKNRDKDANFIQMITDETKDLETRMQALRNISEPRKNLLYSLVRNDSLPVEIRFSAVSILSNNLSIDELHQLAFRVISSIEPASPIPTGILKELQQSGQTALSVKLCLSRKFSTEQDVYQTASLCLDLFGATNEILGFVEDIAHSSNSTFEQRVAAAAVLIMLKKKDDAAHLLYDLCRVSVKNPSQSLKALLIILENLERFDLLHLIATDITVNMFTREAAIDILGKDSKIDLLLDIAGNKSMDEALRIWIMDIIIERGYLSVDILSLMLGMLYDVNAPLHISCEIAKRIGQFANFLTASQGISVAKYINNLGVRQKHERSIFNHFFWGLKTAKWTNRDAVMWMKPIVEGKFENKKVAQELRDSMWEILSDLFMQTEELLSGA